MIKINLYGSPSSGKSTLAGLIFGQMKSLRYNVGFTQEYAKELVYQGIDMRNITEADRIIILGEQFRREKMFDGKVGYMVTDSPMLLTAYYHEKNNSEYSYAKDIVLRHLKEDEYHFWLEPINHFEKEGRSHNEKESLEINKELKKYLKESGIKLISIDGNPEERLNKVLEIILNNQ